MALTSLSPCSPAGSVLGGRPHLDREAAGVAPLRAAEQGTAPSVPKGGTGHVPAAWGPEVALPAVSVLRAPQPASEAPAWTLLTQPETAGHTAAGDAFRESPASPARSPEDGSRPECGLAPHICAVPYTAGPCPDPPCPMGFGLRGARTTAFCPRLRLAPWDEASQEICSLHSLEALFSILGRVPRGLGTLAWRGSPPTQESVVR